MPLRAPAGRQYPVRKAVSQFQRVLGWMKNFSKLRIIAGDELGTIRRSDYEHRGIPFHHGTALNEEGTVPWGGSSDQVHLLLALRLLRRQIGQLVEGAQIGARRGRDDVGIGAVA